ncbi:hypothetical protein [Mycolicibacterium baixiangningiae]|uniref:hypothetical protein n=1 Tax=Mycolicibacterium baixiangningiae TaxID=2761578 RepID=UPI001868E86C|nr:hypothetical protein [Mycolicibacterium baixiangningiae]
MKHMVLGAAVAALVLSGCGSGGGSSPETVTETVSAPPAASQDTTPPGTAPPGTTPPGTTPPGTAPARPAVGQCVRLEPAPDGRYQVFDAGSAQVTYADGRLTVGPVTPAEGWTHEVADQEPAEVEIDFRRGAENLDLEIDVDRDRLEVKVCNDNG